MRFSLISLSAFVLLLGVLAAPARAQADGAEPQTRFMMLNQNVCPGAGEERMIEITGRAFAPVLNQMEAEGLISDWGVLGHAWGDEYNFNWFMVAESLSAWRNAWNTMVQRVSAEHPEVWDEITSTCTLHKDNLYTLYDWD